MNLLDIISPKKHGKKRFTPSFFAKSTFVISVLVFCFFVLVSTLLWQNDTELDVVIPTRTGEEVISEVRNYLDDKKYTILFKMKLVENYLMRDFLQPNIYYMALGE